jgi:hypothetical protein
LAGEEAEEQNHFQVQIHMPSPVHCGLNLISCKIHSWPKCPPSIWTIAFSTSELGQLGSALERQLIHSGVLPADWYLELSQGGSIYTKEIDKGYNPGFLQGHREKSQLSAGHCLGPNPTFLSAHDNDQKLSALFTLFPS